MAWSCCWAGEVHDKQLIWLLAVALESLLPLGCNSRLSVAAFESNLLFSHHDGKKSKK
jgi:hypothetical protein